MGWEDAFSQLNRTVMSRAELLALGASGASLTSAVRSAHLLRLRRDHYALPNVNRQIATAVRVGGRLTCTSALAEAGVFVHRSEFTHICMPPLASRSRSPQSRFVPLRLSERDGAELHWVELLEPNGGSEAVVDIRDALFQSLHCQTAWESVATFDSALHLRLVSEADVDRIFTTAAVRFGVIRKQLDARAESGSESRLRLIVTDAGFGCDLQVKFPGIGRVDMVVEKRLVVEADSRVGHAGWEKQFSDRTRDLKLAHRGMMSLRPTRDHIFYSPELVRDAIESLLRRFP